MNIPLWLLIAGAVHFIVNGIIAEAVRREYGYDCNYLGLAVIYIGLGFAGIEVAIIYTLFMVLSGAAEAINARWWISSWVRFYLGKRPLINDISIDNLRKLYRFELDNKRRKSHLVLMEKMAKRINVEL